jgi:hypothetical protein
VTVSPEAKDPVRDGLFPTIRAHSENGMDKGVKAAFPGPTRPTYYCERYLKND